MRVIGLDMSTNTGLSVIDTEADLMSCVMHTAQISAPKGVTGFERVNHIVSSIVSVQERYKPAFAVIEGYSISRFGGSIITSLEIGSILRFYLWQDGFPYLDVPPTTLKKFVTGKGQSKKEMMILEVYKRFGVTAKTNDIADAIGLGMFGRCAATNHQKEFNSQQRKGVSDCVKGSESFEKALKKLTL